MLQQNLRRNYLRNLVSSYNETLKKIFVSDHTNKKLLHCAAIILRKHKFSSTSWKLIILLRLVYAWATARPVIATLQPITNSSNYRERFTNFMIKIHNEFSSSSEISSLSGGGGFVMHDMKWFQLKLCWSWTYSLRLSHSLSSSHKMNWICAHPKILIEQLKQSQNVHTSDIMAQSLKLDSQLRKKFDRWTSHETDEDEFPWNWMQIPQEDFSSSLLS